MHYHGRVGQEELHTLQRSSQALLYPCDTMSPTETGCITVIEACAAKAVPVITDCDCLGTEFGDVAVINELPLDDGYYVDSIGLAVERRATMIDQLQDFARSRDWAEIAPTWKHVFGREV